MSTPDRVDDWLRDDALVLKALRSKKDAKGRPLVKPYVTKGTEGPPCRCGGRTYRVERTEKVENGRDGTGKMTYRQQTISEWACLDCWHRVAIS